MANPQPDQFTRISNELYEAIMQTNFSKRQRNILDLVIRMSYGCRKKYAILRPSDFEVVGVYKTHVKRELNYLSSANVIEVDGDVISINKDYERWRVSLIKTFDIERYNDILKRNLGVTKKVTKVTETVTDEEDTVTKTVTDGYQNSNSEVTKTVTDTLDNPNNDKGLRARKEILKKNKDNTTATATTEDGYESFTSAHRRIFGFELNQHQMEFLCGYIEEDEMDEQVIIRAMERAAINGMSYSFNLIKKIVNDYCLAGVKTIEQAKAFDNEFDKRRAVYAAGWKSNRGDPGTNQTDSGEQGYYEQYGIVQRL